jgi:hypothetical protein
MRLTYEKNRQGTKLCGMRKCDSCGKEEFMRKPRRWDICVSRDMKQRYDAGKTVPPKQIKKVSDVNFCGHCGRAYEIMTTALQRGKSRQLHCSIKCSREAAGELRLTSMIFARNAIRSDGNGKKAGNTSGIATAMT